MKLWLLLLPALLVLSSASDSDGNVPIPGLQDRIPENQVKVSVKTDRSPLTPAKLQQKSQALSRSRSSSSWFDNGNLKWKTWTGSLPNNAVGLHTKYHGRVDYICKHGCHAGFYNSRFGPYCLYPYGDKEHRGSPFELLVNEGNLEVLEWKAGSHGSVPRNSIRTCSYDKLYVGKHKYGLGKVHPKHEAFFLPWEGKEYWYKDYEVLTINKDVLSEEITNVKYKTDAVKIISYPPETMRISSVSNNQCRKVVKKSTLTKTSTVEKRWDIGSSITTGASTTFTGGIPGVISGSVEVSTEVTVSFSGGETYTEAVSHEVTVEVDVPPNHYCKVFMVAYKYKSDIPFTAQLTRKYRNGQTRSTQISGKYDGVNVGEVRAVVERCKPIENAQPCK